MIYLVEFVFPYEGILPISNAAMPSGTLILVGLSCFYAEILDLLLALCPAIVIAYHREFSDEIAQERNLLVWFYENVRMYFRVAFCTALSKSGGRVKKPIRTQSIEKSQLIYSEMT